MTLTPGSRLGSYEVLAALGAGGMEVYRARDSRLRREVAIRVLPAAIRSDPGRLARFERKAQTASNLNHPNLLTIFEIGEADGLRFIAAEFVAGETLGARLARGPLALRDALEIATQVVSGRIPRTRSDGHVESRVPIRVSQHVHGTLASGHHPAVGSPGARATNTQIR